MEFNGISNEIQSGRLFRGEIQEIPSKVLLTFWGGVINPGFAYYIHTPFYFDSLKLVKMLVIFRIYLNI